MKAGLRDETRDKKIRTPATLRNSRELAGELDFNDIAVPQDASRHMRGPFLRGHLQLNTIDSINHKLTELQTRAPDSEQHQHLEGCRVPPNVAQQARSLVLQF